MMTDERWPLGDALPAKYGGRDRQDNLMPHVATGAPTRIVHSPPAAAESLPAVLWRSRWILLICVVAALGGGLAYIRATTPVYTSTAKLYLDYAGIRLSNRYEPGGRPQTDKYLYTQAELIRSRPILADAVAALASRRLRTFSGVDVPDTYLQKNVDVSVGRKDETIAVSLRSPYPTEAADIVNQIVEEYMRSRSERGQQDSAQVLKTLQNELVRVNGDLDRKRNELTEFQSKQMPMALGGSDQGGGVMQRYLESQNAYIQAHINMLQAAEFRRGVRTLAADPSALRHYIQMRDRLNSSLGTDRDRSAMEAKLVDLHLNKESFLKAFTADHPKVVELETETQQLEARLAEMDDRFVKAAIAAAEQQYMEAKNCHEQLERLCNEQREYVVMLNAEVAQYQRLRSQVDQLTQYAQTVEQQVREISRIVDEDVGQLRMSILESALPAQEPSDPQMAKVLALGLVVGLLFGGGIAVTRDWLNQNLRSVDEISRTLGVPTLGVIPAMSRWHRARVRGQRVFLHPQSHESEAFRTVRTAVFFGAHKDQTKTLLVTSPSSGDGKSTVVSNLGIAMAMAGQRTIILDADLRRASQRRIFGIDPRSQCLGGILTGNVKLGAATQATRIDGLSLLICGDYFTNPAEVLNSRQFAALLRVLARRYDRVLVDAPPVTAVTDAQILGALCDRTILVVKADKTTRKMARHAIDALESVGSRILGVVVNEAGRGNHRYGYYGKSYRPRGSRRHMQTIPTTRAKGRPDERTLVVSQGK